MRIKINEFERQEKLRVQEEKSKKVIATLQLENDSIMKTI